MSSSITDANNSQNESETNFVTGRMMEVEDDVIAHIANEQLIHHLVEHENISLYFSKKPGNITEKQVSRQDYAQ